MILELQIFSVSSVYETLTFYWGEILLFITTVIKKKKQNFFPKQARPPPPAATPQWTPWLLWGPCSLWLLVLELDSIWAHWQVLVHNGTSTDWSFLQVTWFICHLKHLWVSLKVFYKSILLLLLVACLQMNKLWLKLGNQICICNRSILHMLEYSINR